MTELPHFEIEGTYGGNQDWMRSPWMKLGGCAALAAVDTCIYLTMHKGASGLCPEGTFPLSIASYNEFAERIRPYLSPRFMGVSRLSLYVDGFSAYLRDCGCTSLSMEAFPMGTPLSAAEAALKAQLDAGYLVPILHLLPKAPALKEYRWHWFLLNACREDPDGLQVRAVTYGASEWLRFEDLWNEQDPKNGGLILYHAKTPPVPAKTLQVAAAVLCDRLELPDKIFATARGYGEHKGRWEFPGGKLEPGESPAEAIQREIREELNAEIQLGKLLAIAEEDTPNFHLTLFCYLALLQPGSPLELKEAAEGRWLTRDELFSVDWLPADRKLAEILYAEMTDASTFHPEEND